MKTALLCLALAATAARGQDLAKPIGPMRVSGGVMAGQILNKVAPIYPPDAEAAHVEGAVVMHAIIGKDGKIANLTAISGNDMLRASALEAVSQWAYKPYLLNGRPTEIDTTITVNYTFDSNPAPSADADAPASGTGANDSLRIHLEPGQLQGMLIHKVRAVYPLAAKQARIAGTVVMHVIIGTDGHVASVNVLSGPRELQQAAVDAVHQSIYKPLVVQGVAREIDTTITTDFTFGG